MFINLEKSLLSKDPEDILVYLGELSQSSLNINNPIDDLVISSFHILKDEYLKDFLDILYDLFIGMRDPRNIVVLLFNLQKKSSVHSLLISKLIFFIVKNYDFQFDNFYKIVKDSLSLKNLQDDTEEKLMFIINMLHNNNSVNIKYMKSIVKKLISISLDANSHIVLSILYTVLHILRCNPVLYSLIEEDDGIYNEIAIYSVSILEISSIANQIKKEAKNKQNRVKFVNLTNLKFPKIVV